MLFEYGEKEIRYLSDDEVIKELSSIRGIGVWTAKMIMTFCMQRPDILTDTAPKTVKK